MRGLAKEYIGSVGHWWWVIVVGFGGGGIGYALNMLPDVVIPIWVWVGFTILGIIFAQFLAYRDVRNRFIKQVTIPNQIEGILTQLAKLRATGVVLRNIGLELKEKDEVDKWIRQVQGWKEAVAKEIVKVSVSEANIFLTEDLVDTALFKDKGINELHRVFLAMASKNTEQIRGLVERYSLENLAKKSGIEK